MALISPPSANRALRGRLFLVCAWLILGVVCLALTCSFLKTGGHHGPLALWVGGSVLLFCLQFLISINERDSWGPRVTRTIPRNRLLRTLAFLFYSGSAGGVLLSVACIGLTLLVCWYWRFLFPYFSFANDLDDVLRIFAAIALYTFCFGMSVVLLRAYLFADKIRSLFNWVLALLLAGLGCLLPWIAALLIYSDRFARQTEPPWWLLTNPPFSVYEIGRDHRYRHPQYTEVCFIFLGVWTLLLAAVSIPWMVQQMARFQPAGPQVRGRTAAKAETEAEMAYPVDAK